MTERDHTLNGYRCPTTEKPAERIYTDHARPGLFNACEHCGEDKTPAQRLAELEQERRAEHEKDPQ